TVGWWTTHKAFGPDTVRATGIGAARHLEMATSWHPNDLVTAWYTSKGTTPADAAWQISADLRWAGNSAPTNSLALYADQGLNQLCFGVSFTGTSVAWTAGTQKGTFVSATGLDNQWRKLSVSYHPLTGWATATLGAETIFNVYAGAGLLVKAVHVGKYCPGELYDTSLLSVDNLTAGAALTPAPPAVPYRGFTVLSLDRPVLEEALRWNANQVRFMMCPIGRAKSVVGQYQAAWRKMIAELPTGLDNAKALGLAVVLDLHQIPNDHPETYSPDGEQASRDYWYDQGNQQVLIDCWRDIAKICKDRDQVIWFDLYNEPLDWFVVHQTPSYPPVWPIWAQATIDAIRQIDRRHPIAIEPGPGMLCWGFNKFPPLKDSCQPVIYSVHLYQPLEYTHQGVNGTRIVPWPGQTGDSGGGMWDAKRLEVELAAVIEFQKKHGVRIWVGEFSAARWAPNAAGYLRDCLDIFEKYGWDWNYHALDDAGVWRLEFPDEVDLYDAQGKYVRTGLAVPNAGFFYAPYCTPEIGKPPLPTGRTDRGKVMKEYLDRNRTLQPRHVDVRPVK
ncbi:MAG: cellulase family glycosylhydrolase, partial [Lentisphaeria bacterium]